MKLGILKNEFDEGHFNWGKACEKNNIEFKIIDLTSNNWLEEVESENFDGFLACPPGREALYKKLYDERIYILNKTLKKFVYPNYDEISLHENKKYLSYWLKANKIPHPKTFVFYSLNNAVGFFKNKQLPIVAKMNIGASGKGVKIFKEKTDVLNYLKEAFSTGIRQSWGPNILMGDYKNRIISLLKNPKRIIRKLTIYKKNYLETQKGFVIFQDFVKHDYEWRVVKIGDSFFGHKKVKTHDKASGTKGIIYDLPPDDLLDFVDHLCSKFNFNCMAVDLFEKPFGGYYVNELQCIFGHVQDHICESNNNPGRIIKRNGQWIFEEGIFNENLSYDLRLLNLVNILKSKQV